MRSLVAVVACVLALGACSADGSDGSGGSDDGAGDGDAGGSTSGSSSPGDPEPTPPEVSLAEVCEEVTLGIDAFNYGDYDETVERFEAAVPLAEAAAEAAPSEETEAMLEAVRYYAELPADEYLEASGSSQEFQTHKFTTLTLCDYQNPPADGPSSGIDA